MHTEYTALMSLALDREANQAEMTRLREHLAECAACAFTWEQWRLLDRRFASAPSATPPGDLMQRLAARLEEQQRLKRRRLWIRSGFVAAWAAVFAAVLLALTLCAWWGLRHPVEVSIVLSSAALLLSSLSWLLRGVGALAEVVGAPTVGLGIAAGMALTLGLGALWVWVAMHSRRWARSQVAVSAGETRA